MILEGNFSRLGLDPSFSADWDGDGAVSVVEAFYFIEAQMRGLPSAPYYIESNNDGLGFILRGKVREGTRKAMLFPPTGLRLTASQSKAPASQTSSSQGTASTGAAPELWAELHLDGKRVENPTGLDARLHTYVFAGYPGGICQVESVRLIAGKRDESLGSALSVTPDFTGDGLADLWIATGHSIYREGAARLLLMPGSASFSLRSENMCPERAPERTSADTLEALYPPEALASGAGLKFGQTVSLWGERLLISDPTGKDDVSQSRWGVLYQVERPSGNGLGALALLQAGDKTTISSFGSQVQTLEGRAAPAMLVSAPYTYSGTSNQALAGATLQALPAQTKDGLPELVIAAPNQTVNGNVAVGAVYTLNKARATSLTLVPTGTDYAVTTGRSAGDYYGSSISTRQEDGKSWLVVGQPGGSTPGVYWTHWMVGGTQNWTFKPDDIWEPGRQVYLLPDFDQDGQPELLVGAAGSRADVTSEAGVEPLFLFWGPGSTVQ